MVQEGDSTHALEQVAQLTQQVQALMKLVMKNQTPPEVTPEDRPREGHPPRARVVHARRAAVRANPSPQEGLDEEDDDNVSLAPSSTVGSDHSRWRQK
ncbi:hypothetical protein HPP92_025989 [Vanilla planifolia]|uniref:Uncharacterized protein n=1 Tax=Vanilla planifolia TaxID=51239 RepID=A0A835PI24_VANPL|nr:hypothetical protein HPP92_026271 [Vanilla planifolia]KAG0451898.1 hypothetical protein HPP92_025989 [Vanilla planifolia]